MDEVTLTAYANEIRTLSQTGQSDQAIALGRHVLHYYPKDIATYELMAEAALQQGDLENALELFRRVLSADPENAVAYIGLAIVLEKQKLTEEAVWHLERAFELAPDDQEVRQELQRLYAETGAAVPRVKLMPGALARLYAQQGLYDRAIHEYQFLLNTSPNRYDLSTALIEATWRAGRMREAAELAQKLIEKLPYSLKANLILGTALQESGVQEGATYLQNAQALDPRNHVAREMLGARSPLEPADPSLPRYVPGAEPPPAAQPVEPTPDGEWFAESKAEDASVDIDLSQLSGDKSALDLAREFFQVDESTVEGAPQDLAPSTPVEAEPARPEPPVDLPVDRDIEMTDETAPAEPAPALPSDLPPWLRAAFGEVTPPPAESKPEPHEQQPAVEAPATVPDWLSEMAQSLGAAEPQVREQKVESESPSEPAALVEAAPAAAVEATPRAESASTPQLIVEEPAAILESPQAHTEPQPTPVDAEPAPVAVESAAALPEQPSVELVTPAGIVDFTAPVGPAPADRVETPTLLAEPPSRVTETTPDVGRAESAPSVALPEEASAAMVAASEAALAAAPSEATLATASEPVPSDEIETPVARVETPAPVMGVTPDISQAETEPAPGTALSEEAPAETVAPSEPMLLAAPSEPALSDKDGDSILSAEPQAPAVQVIPEISQAEAEPAPPALVQASQVAEEQTLEELLSQVQPVEQIEPAIAQLEEPAVGASTLEAVAAPQLEAEEPVAATPKIAPAEAIPAAVVPAGKPTSRPEEVPDATIPDSDESASVVIARSDAEAAQTLARAAEALEGPALAWGGALDGAVAEPVPAPEPAAPKVEQPGPSSAAAQRQRTLKAAERLEQARFLRDDNRMDEALVEYEYIIQHAPRLVPQVIPDLEEITTRPNTPLQAHRILGDAYTRVDRLSDALAHYRYVLEQTPANAG